MLGFEEGGSQMRRTGTAIVALALIASAAVPAAIGTDEERATETIDPRTYVSSLGQDLLEDPSRTEPAAQALAGDLLAARTSLSGVLSASQHHRLAPASPGSVPILEAGSLAQEIQAAWRAEGQPLTAAEHAELASRTDALPSHVERALAWLVAGAAEADTLRPDAAEALSDEALATLLEDAMPGDPIEPPIQRARLLGSTSPTDLVEHETALASLDVERLMAAHATMALAVDRATAELEAGSYEPDIQSSAAQTGDVLNESTPYGRIVVSGTGSHTYTQSAFVQIDLGGDDRWANRAGAVQAAVLDLLGVSPPPLPTSPGFSAWIEDVRDRIRGSHNVSIALDVGGNDVYDEPEPGAQGFGALGGFGALVDLGGQDSYTAGTFAQGAGFVGGAGFLVDAGGDDRYEIARQGQGFAQDAAAGFLADAQGTDVYTGGVLAQGTGFSANLVGALIDGDGDDTYRCTGIADFSSFVIPVGLPRPGSVCHATGFGGTGVLVDGGGGDVYETVGGFQAFTLVGTGLLVDLGGSDTYDAGEWSNGNGVIGFAAIVDTEGSETYSSVQTSGVTWLDIYVGSNAEAYTAGAGVIVDRTGDDTYTSDVDKASFLPQYACGAGCSFLGGIGLLLDGGGNDAYTSEVGQGGTLGGAALLADASGDDTYEMLYGSTRGQGFAGIGVAPAGLLATDCTYGVLHDGAGQDSYDNPTTDFGTRTDGAAWGQGDYGRGMDAIQGTASYATGQLPADLEDLASRRLCEALSGL